MQGNEEGAKKGGGKGATEGRSDFRDRADPDPSVGRGFDQFNSPVFRIEALNWIYVPTFGYLSIHPFIQLGHPSIHQSTHDAQDVSILQNIFSNNSHFPSRHATPCQSEYQSPQLVKSSIPPLGTGPTSTLQLQSSPHKRTQRCRRGGDIWHNPCAGACKSRKQVNSYVCLRR